LVITVVDNFAQTFVIEYVFQFQQLYRVVWYRYRNMRFFLYKNLCFVSFYASVIYAVWGYLRYACTVCTFV
jgi:hypothetical protein